MRRYSLEDFPFFKDREDDCPANCANAIHEGDPEGSAGITRRGFLQLIAGSAALGVAGGIMPWRGTIIEAHADEEGAVSYTITVYKHWEMPIILYDMSNEGQKTPVPGWKATVESYTTGVTVDIEGNDQGYVILNVRDTGLSDSETARQTYEFGGKICVTCPSYRTYETGYLSFESGSEVDVPTEPDDGTPYLQLATFNYWDIQYESGNEFIRGEDNAAEHVFALKVAAADDLKATKATVTQGDRVIATAAFDDPEDGIQGMELKGNFLQIGKPECLDVTNAADAASAVGVVIEFGDRTLKVTTKLNVIDKFFQTEGYDVDGSLDVGDILAAVDPSAPSVQSGDSTLGDSGFSGSGITVEIPKGIKIIGGNQITIPIPGSYIKYDWTPSGTCRFCVVITLKRDMSENPSFSDLFDWKGYQAQNAADSTQKALKDYSDIMSKSAKDSSTTEKSGGMFGASFAVTFGGGMYWKRLSQADEDQKKELAKLYPGVKDDIVRGGFDGFAALDFLVSKTWQFYPGGFPLYLSIEFGVGFSISLLLENFGYHTGTDTTTAWPKVNVLGTADPKQDDSSIVLQVYVTGAVSAGAGISGLLSVGVRGSVGFTYTQTGYLKSAFREFVRESGHDTKRYVIGFQANAGVTVSFFLFSGYFPIFDTGDLCLFDSWNEKAQVELDENRTPRIPESMRIGGGASIDGFLTDFGPGDPLSGHLSEVTNETLQAIAEAKQTGVAMLTASETGEAYQEPVFEPIAGRGATFAAHPRLADSLDSLCSFYPGQDISQDSTRFAIKPVETKVYEGVFSNPRMRVFEYLGDKYLLRILPVIIDDGTARTRICISTFDEGAGVWSAPQVLGEGPTDWAEDRRELYDYDFDFVTVDPFLGAQRFKNGGFLHIVLISGNRDQVGCVGDAASKTCVSVIDVAAPTFAVIRVASYTEIEGYSGGESRMLCMPYIDTAVEAVEKGTFGEPIEVSATVAGAFLRTTDSDDPNALLDGPYVEEPTLWLDGGYTPVPFGRKFTTLTKGGNVLVHAPESFKDPRAKTSMAFAVKRTYHASDKCDMLVAWSYIAHDSGDALKGGSDDEGFARIMSCTVTDGKNDPPSSVLRAAWYTCDELNGTITAKGVKTWYKKADDMGVKDFDAFLITGKFWGSPRLFRVDIVGPEGDTDLSDVSVDPRCDISLFDLTDDGNTILYASICEGDMPDTQDCHGNTIPGEKGVKNYDINAMNCVYDSDGNYKFIAPYSLCRVKHPVDGFSCVEGASSFDFLYNTITSLEASTSDIYYVTQPKILQVTVTDLSSDSPFVCSGEPETFTVWARNDGNKVISSFDVEITAQDEEKGIDFSQTVHLDLTSDAVKTFACAADVMGMRSDPEERTASGEVSREVALSAIAESGALCPGEERPYQFDLAIPDDWQGNITLQARAVPDSPKLSRASLASESSDPRMNAILGSSRFDVLESHVKPVTAQVSTYGSSVASVAEASTLEKSAYSWSGRGGDPSEPDGEDGSAKGGSVDPGAQAMQGGGAGGRSGDGDPAVQPGRAGVVKTPTAAPRTGDELPLFGVAATAALAAGAGFVAYSKRRTMIEADCQVRDANCDPSDDPRDDPQ